MELLSPYDLKTLEYLHSRLMAKRNDVEQMTSTEADALRQALPRWIAMERTVTEAHVDAARQSDPYPDDYPGAEIYLWPNVERRLPWWRRFARWWRHEIEEFWP